MLNRDVRTDDLLQLIAEMKDSKTVLVSYHANDPNVGMSASIDLAKFKMFVCDTGLFATLIIGTIMKQIGQLVPGTVGQYLVIIGGIASAMTGAGVGLGTANKLNADPLVKVSAVTAGQQQQAMSWWMRIARSIGRSPGHSTGG